MCSSRVLTLAIAMMTGMAAAAPAVSAGPPDSDTATNEESHPSPGDPDSGIRHLLILCGHPGDDEHRAQFVESVDQLRESLTTRYGFDPDAATVLFGTDEMLGDGGPAPQGPAAACTRENISAITEELHGTLQSDDALWVIVMGHSHFDGLHSWFNLAGPDIDEEAFARSFEGLACRELVFWITIPASGFYIRPLSADGRVIISATEADREINETIFPHSLANVLAEPPPEEEWDADGDGRSTVLDLYITVARSIAQAYLDENALSTEHARLEDNGDGRGSEVQRGFLSRDLGGQLEAGESPRPRAGTEDGAAAAAIAFDRPVGSAEQPVDSVDQVDDPAEQAVLPTGCCFEIRT